MIKQLTPLFLALVLLTSYNVLAQTQLVNVQKSNNDFVLQVDGKPFFVNGMNWDYFPRGTNYNYSLWNQNEEIIKAALDEEMLMLKNMGVNSIRVYTGIPKKWIQYIYETHGIYTMLNHAFGRYGLTIDGAWVPNTEYADPKTRQLLLKEVTEMVNEYKDTPGLLLYLLGNENNYGLFWEGAETEDIPIEDRKSTIRAEAMYKLFNEATLAMKQVSTNHPIAMCNGDLQFLDIIARECKDVDIYGTNMYRGVSFGDAFYRVKSELDKPILFTEFGSDAFNVIDQKEDQFSQAFYLLGNWKEIYENAAGQGKAGNSIGGYTFQFSDGWWKYGQTSNLDVHDTNASWSNGGYPRDYIEGQNNMNEEWFGICAKGPTSPRGLYTLYPRAAYYMLKDVHKISPLETGVTSEFLANYFNNINIMEYVLTARADKALAGESGSKLGISNLRAEFTTFNTGGHLITTPSNPEPNSTTFPDQLGFDHLQSYFIGVEANPVSNFKADVNLNVLGNVATNPIDEIFYENRGRRITVDSEEGPIPVFDNNRVQVYQASFEWNEKDFDLRGFYRTGHYHWGYEGDFFGLYPEANYGPNLDLYNGEILGIEVDGKGSLDGFKATFGPQLWWAANPGYLLKYSRKIGKFDVTGIYHEDIDNASNAVSSVAIPFPKTRRFTLHIKSKLGNLGYEIGGIWGGEPLIGRKFQFVIGESGNYTVLEDRIEAKDTWGGKVKFTYSKGVFNWYASAAAQGLVARGGADQTRTFTGWRLKDSGSGNQTNFLTGFTYNVGNLQIAPNFLWQKPLVDPIPNDVPAPGRLRNIVDDPFAVRENRETVAGELLLTYDPTPATWFYEWDNDMAEDAKFAFSSGLVFRYHPTNMDAAIGFLSARTQFAFDQSAPEKNLWEVNNRVVSKLTPDFGLIANIYFGNGQANGSDPRTIKRFGSDLRVIYKKIKIINSVKINDWGPFDYHRDFNLTFPVQLMLDVSTSFEKQSWFIMPGTRVGIRGTWRSLNEFSPRYLPTQTANQFSTVPIISPVGFDNGNEWEIRTYVHINIIK